MEKAKVSIFWFRRDLRIEDNRGLFEALNSGYPVLPLFIFDTNIVEELKEKDARISFIYAQLIKLNKGLSKHSSGVYFKQGRPEEVWSNMLDEFDVKGVYFNEDYEPYAIKRDKAIQLILADSGVGCNIFKDQVVFSKEDILKSNQTPYTVYTPYKNKWLEKITPDNIKSFDSASKTNYFPHDYSLPKLVDLGFQHSAIEVIRYELEDLDDYEHSRNFPAINKTSHLSPHLRFGTISIRSIVGKVSNNPYFLNQLIWREFFMQILYHFPKVVDANFKSKYDSIEWRNNKSEFERWKNGQTGYPMVDAGIRELNNTGYMHNRVRMIVAGFLCKHLLIDWRWGEAYFAEKLLDYDLAQNNGNWQWVAGTGCDAAPYFRVFNPTIQLKKFDPDLVYTRKWIPEFDSLNYPLPMVDHKMARERAISVYKKSSAKLSK